MTFVVPFWDQPAHELKYLILTRNKEACLQKLLFMLLLIS